MKFLYSLLVSILALSVHANPYRLCCCTHIDNCGHQVCDGSVTQRIVEASGGRFIRAKKSWDKAQGAPVGGAYNWMYADDKLDDGFLGEHELKILCRRQRRYRKCFDPNENYKNDGPRKKGGKKGGFWSGNKLVRDVMRKRPKKGKKEEEEEDTWPVCPI